MKLRLASSGQYLNHLPPLNAQIDDLLIFRATPATPDGEWLPISLASILGAEIQAGYDQVIESMTIANGGSLQFPRDAALAPVQVHLTGITPGNFLEVDFSGTFSAVGADAGQGSAILILCPIVSFLAAPTFPADFDFVNNAGSSQLIPEQATVRDCIRGLAAFEIPGGVSEAFVRLVYSVDNLTGGPTISLNGTDNKSFQDTGLSLKVRELRAANIGQAGPSTLVPL